MLTNKDSRKYNILVIEDNLGDFILIEDYLLEYLVPNLVRAGSLKEARELLHSNNTGFDLVMLDLTLPDSTGADLITQIIDMCPDLPIIVLTGYGDFEFSIKSLALGVSDYLLKDELTPFSLYKSLVYNIERKKTHSELEESRKRYSNLFHLSPDPTWVLDVSTNRFLDVNDAAIREYGFTHDEFLAMTVEQVETENDPEAAAAPHLINSPEYDKTHLREIYRHRKKNGDIIYVENQTSEILFNGKGAKIMVVHDITERIKYINAIEKQNQRFSEISWIQSHVVRAPIARLMGLIGLLQHPASDEKLKSELLAHVLECANELDGIVREITLKAEEIDINNELS